MIRDIDYLEYELERMGPEELQNFRKKILETIDKYIDRTGIKEVEQALEEQIYTNNVYKNENWKNSKDQLYYMVDGLPYRAKISLLPLDIKDLEELEEEQSLIKKEYIKR